MALTASITPDARIRVPDHVVFRTFPNETVVLNLNTGRYHGLNPVGGRMLDALSAGRRVDEAAKRLAEAHSWSASKVEADMLEFCSDLLTRGLIELDGGDQNAPGSDG